MRTSCAAAVVLLAVSGTAWAGPFDPAALEGTWRGEARTGDGAAATTLVVARGDGGGLRVTLDVAGLLLGCVEESGTAVDLAEGADYGPKGIDLRRDVPFAGPLRLRVAPSGRVTGSGGPPAACEETSPRWSLSGRVRNGVLTLRTRTTYAGGARSRSTVRLVREPPRGRTPLRALVIPANFPDARSALTRGEIQAYFDSDTFRRAGAARSVRSWVHEVSAGRVDLTAEVPEFVTLPNPAATYRTGDAGAIVRDAVAALDARGFDFAPFDGDGDGVVDLVGVLYRGPAPRFGTGDGPRRTEAPGLSPPLAVDGVEVRRSFVFPDWFPAAGTKIDLGAMTHEGLWHALGGLPDLNQYDGSWWLGIGIAEPSHFSAYGKEKLGWIDVEDVEAAGDVTLAPVDRSARALRLWIDPWREHEYFLLENRRRAGADRALPGAGLLVWHVDEMADQTGFLALEQADGLDELRVPTGGRGFGKADAGDPFPGSARRRAFTAATTPSSRARDGRDTGVRIEEIALDGADVRARLTPSSGLLGFTLKHDEVYPRFSDVWGPVGGTGGNAAGEHVAVRFTTPVAAELREVRLSVVHPGTRQATVAVHGDFAPDRSLAGPPRATAAGAVAGDFAWTTLTLPAPLALAAGETFVVDLVLDDPVVAVEKAGMPSGRSWYRAPGSAAYVPVGHDVRLRAHLAPLAD